MRIIGFLILLLCVATFPAQSFKTIESEVVLEDIGKPVLYTKEGLTVFQFNDLKKGDMLLTVFDSKHRIIVSRKPLVFTTFKYRKHKDYSTVEARKWEDSENSSATISFSSLYSVKTKYKVRIDLKSGNVLSEDQPEPDITYPGDVYRNGSLLITTSENDIDGISKEDVDQARFQGLASLTFSVSAPAKDGNFVVKYDYVENKFQYAHLCDHIFKDDNVYFLTKLFKFNTAAEYSNVREYSHTYNQLFKGPQKIEASLYISKLDLRSKKFQHIEIYKIEDNEIFSDYSILANADTSFFDVKIDILRDKRNGNIIQVGKSMYEIKFIPVDAKAMQKGIAFFPPQSKLNGQLSSEELSKGMMVRCSVDKAGNLFTIRNNNVTTFQSMYGDQLLTNPEKFVISVFDKNGKDLYALVYPYNTDIVDAYEASTGYIVGAGTKSNMIFLNEVPGNIELAINEPHENVKNIEKAEAAVIEVNSSGQAKVSRLFPAADVESENKFCDFSTALYVPGSNMYVVKEFEGKGYKKSRASWILIQ